jgi:ketosteroid isomerase-like protein
MTTTTTRALELAQAFFAGFEARSPEAVGALLSPTASLIIRLDIDGEPDPWYAFEGREQILAYIASVAAKFDHVAFLDKEWTVANDGSSVFLQANGDILSSAEKLEYRNVYVFKLELEGGAVARVVEYANPVTYANLGIQDSEAESAARSS